MGQLFLPSKFAIDVRKSGSGAAVAFGVEIPSGITQLRFEARALLLGARIDLRNWPRGEVLATLPFSVALEGGGMACLFRHGVVVLFAASDEGKEALIRRLEPLIDQPYTENLLEGLAIEVRPDGIEGLRDDSLFLRSASVERLQLIAEVLAKSVLLDFYERRLARDFDRIEPLAHQLATTGRLQSRPKAHLQSIGALLLAEHRMVGRAEIQDKPELLWEHPELDRLYVTLESEFEIGDRDEALDRKITLAARTVRTLVDLLNAKHTLRVEWYIVLLIVFEILLTVYESWIA